METVVPLGGAAVDDIRQLCSDSEVSDDGSSSGGGGLRPLRTGPLCVVRLDDFNWVVPDRVPDILESGRATEEYLSDLRHVEEVLPDVFPVVFAGAAVVPMSLPTVADVVSSAVFAEEYLSDLRHVEEVLSDVFPVVFAGCGCCADVLAHGC